MKPQGHPRKLLVLFDEVESRCARVLDEFEQWPCRPGCDHCCRHLSREPQLTEAEWNLLRDALERLPRDTVRKQLEQRLASWSAPEANKTVTCPLLDTDRGVCSVYEARPTACRSYGFYRARGHDAWCDHVAEHIADSEDGIVWGNQDALERALTRTFGPARGLSHWLALPRSVEQR